MTHQFIINDENIVNEYGYRVMTEGIDTVQFMRNPIVLYIHERGFKKANGPEGNEVIARVIKLWKDKGQLMAEVEFDVAEEFSKRIAGKVERGYVRMASIYADVIATSTDLADVLPGQIFETVTESKLVELSIVDIGGNDNALKLSRGGKKIKLKRLNTKTKTNIDMNIQTIALSLGMGADSAAENIMAKVNEIKLAKDKAEARVKELEAGIKDSEKAEAVVLVDKAVKLGLIPEGLKESQLKSFEGDFNGQKVVLSKLIGDKEADDAKDGKHQTVREVVLSGKGGNGKKTVELSFDYLQKNDPEELRRIHKEQPDEYVRLSKEYAAGKRYTV